MICVCVGWGRHPWCWQCVCSRWLSSEGPPLVCSWEYLPGSWGHISLQSWSQYNSAPSRWCPDPKHWNCNRNIYWREFAKHCRVYLAIYGHSLSFQHKHWDPPDFIVFCQVVCFILDWVLRTAHQGHEELCDILQTITCVLVLHILHCSQMECQSVRVVINLITVLLQGYFVVWQLYKTVVLDCWLMPPYSETSYDCMESVDWLATVRAEFSTTLLWPGPSQSPKAKQRYSLYSLLGHFVHWFDWTHDAYKIWTKLSRKCCVFYTCHSTTGGVTILTIVTKTDLNLMLTHAGSSYCIHCVTLWGWRHGNNIRMVTSDFTKTSQRKFQQSIFWKLIPEIGIILSIIHWEWENEE